MLTELTLRARVVRRTEAFVRVLVFVDTQTSVLTGHVVARVGTRVV